MGDSIIFPLGLISCNVQYVGLFIAGFVVLRHIEEEDVWESFDIVA